MMIQLDAPCPCQSGKSFGECCNAVERKLLAASIHEAGHALSLPPEAFSHCSLLPSHKCPPCLTGDGEAVQQVVAGHQLISEGHTVCTKEFEHTITTNIAYTVGGGAAEEACGAYEPERMDFPNWGRYPSSMISDFDNMEKDFQEKGLVLAEYREDVSVLFKSMIAIDAENLGDLWRWARELREKGYITSDDLASA